MTTDYHEYAHYYDDDYDAYDDFGNTPTWLFIVSILGTLALMPAIIVYTVLFNS